MPKITFSEELTNFIRNTSSHLVVNGEDWYYMPWWYKKAEGDCEFQLVKFEDLPPHVVKALSELREGAPGVITATLNKPEE